MKNKITKVLAVILSLSMVFSFSVMTSAAVPETNEDAAEYANDWELVTDEATGESYWMLNAVYVQNPTVGTSEERGAIDENDDYIQHIVVYAPEDYMMETEDGVVINPDAQIISNDGAVYTAENAPIIYYNHSGGYTSSTINAVNMGWLEQGYVHVEIQTRGKEITDLDGKYIGEFPLIMVDLKAGIKWLRHFDAELPGDAESIVSTGHSSGGAVSAMLGASGDASVFDEYFEEIGAYDESDAIYICHASAPITNLSSADASYEWFQTANPTYFLFNAMAYDREGNDISSVMPVGPRNKYPLGANILGGAHEDELSAKLYDWYVDYVQDLGLDLGDDGRSGDFYDGFVEIYEEGLEDLVERYDYIKANTISSTLTSSIADCETAMDYLKKIGLNKWFTYDEETGEIEISSLDDMVVNHIARKKMCPSLDSYNYKSNENNAFKDADGNIEHFSGTVYQMLKELYDDYEENGSENFTGMKTKDADGNYTVVAEFSEDDAAYLKALVEDYESAGSEEDMYMLEVMSPVNYIVETDEDSEFYATSAAHWRIRNGSEDGDHGAPAGWLIYQVLQEYQPDVDSQMGIAWGYPHEWSEMTDQDFYSYVDSVMLKDEKVENTAVVVFEDNSDGIYADEDVARYFPDGDVQAGINALMDAGQVYINGKAVPKSADDTAALSEVDTRDVPGYAINGLVSLFTENGQWSEKVHKGEHTFDTFEEARDSFFNGTSQMTGLTMELTIEDGVCTRIDTTVKEALRVDEIIENTDGTINIKIGEFGLNLAGRAGSQDLEEIAVFDAENFADDIEEQDMILYWEDADGWHAEKAESETGYLTEGQDHGYYIFNDEYLTDCNITKFYLTTGNRPGQYLTAHLGLGLEDEEVTMWTINGYPFGFTSTDADSMLEKAIENANIMLGDSYIDAEAAQVPVGQYTVTEAQYDAFAAQIAAAEKVLDDEDATDLDKDNAIYNMYNVCPAKVGKAGTSTLKITAQPENVYEAVGDKATLSVEAEGEGLTYQWEYTTDGTNWITCSSSASKKATFSFKMYKNFSGRIYRCIITDEGGCEAISYGALVSIPFEITEQPEDVSAAVGDTAKLTVKAAGVGLTYQWSYSKDGGETWITCTSSASAKATFSFKMYKNFAGRMYKCTVSDFGGNELESEIVTLSLAK